MCSCATYLQGMASLAIYYVVVDLRYCIDTSIPVSYVLRVVRSSIGFPSSRAPDEAAGSVVVSIHSVRGLAWYYVASVAHPVLIAQHGHTGHSHVACTDCYVILVSFRHLAPHW